MNGSMTKTYFHASTDVKNFLFHYLDVSGAKGIILLCVIVCAITMLFESSKALVFYLESRLRQNPLTYGQTDISIQDRSPLFSSLMIPSSLEQIKTRRRRYFVFGFVIHTLNILVAYFIMLAVMSYNAWVALAVVIGSGLGYFIFGAVTSMNRARFAGLKVPTGSVSNLSTGSATSQTRLVKT